MAELKNRPVANKERTRSADMAMDDPASRSRSPRARDVSQRDYHHAGNGRVDIPSPPAHSPAFMPAVPMDPSSRVNNKPMTPETPIVK